MSAFIVKEGVTVRDLVVRSTSSLAAAGIDQPRLDAEILLAEVLAQATPGGNRARPGANFAGVVLKFAPRGADGRRHHV